MRLKNNEKCVSVIEATVSSQHSNIFTATRNVCNNIRRRLVEKKGVVINSRSFNGFPVIIAYRQFLNQLPAGTAKIRPKAVHSGGLEKPPGTCSRFAERSGEGPDCVSRHVFYVFTYLRRRTRLVPVRSILLLCPKQSCLAPKICPYGFRNY